MKNNLESLLEKIKKHPRYKKYDGRFPTLGTLTRYPEKNLPIIVEQGNRLIHPKESDLKNQEDISFITEQFISDIYQFLTESHIYIEDKTIASYGQSIITSNKLYHIACSQQFKNKYKNVNFLMNKIEFNFYSIPFILRLSIESKLKSMIGFQSCDITRMVKNRKITDTNKQEISVPKVLTFLNDNDLVDTPCSFDEMKRIYSWACRFTHNGTKEYVWLRLKALQTLHNLFDYEYIKNNNLKDKRSNSINYLKAGVSINTLMEKINNDSNFKGHYKLYLSHESFDENFGLYNDEEKKYY
ncbi:MULTISPECIES: hypothetical protein [Pectobacterium]|uniref:Uncharacterized protein n=1 Tax=Pectobacterium carotovorum subsp. carotovorum (strain PC1) TaxID=561230 RepID=C6DEH9_PECCP|nr:hypothetical protein [Pectobacterium carotovorum]ACT12664.1 conserved hypothetical protein [Pectobacterium carotovorum subsp. carotovorum PC1]